MTDLLTADRVSTCPYCGLGYRGPWWEHGRSDEHFMARVRVVASGCWEWLGAKNRKGYGIYGQRTAHREAWTRFRGPIPAGMLVCHTCDNPPCVNPDHLWLGTIADNNRDRDEKGRAAKQRTACKKGHPYGAPTKSGWNVCRVCVRERQRGYIRPSRRRQ